MKESLVLPPPDYDLNRMPFMRQQGEQKHVTESYVSCPPALVIQDLDGNLWTLGFDQGGWHTGEFEFDVVRNACRTGEFACRIEFRNGKVKIFGRDGWRSWDRNRKCFI
jgi:hypothetical protein